MQQYKALMCDLDGTTIPNRLDGMPSPKVREAIRKAQEKIAVCIATGRAPTQALPIVDALEITDPIITLNGALILDGKTRNPIYEQPMQKEDFFTVLNVVKKTKLHFTIDTPTETIMYTNNRIPEKPLAIFTWDLTETEANTLIRHFSHIPTLALYKTVGWKEGTVGLNISHKLATKQHAILEVAKLLEIKTREIIGIGDGPNDFPLLMACGFKVAMGNAIPDLKAIADYVAPKVEEDGVAEVIEKFVLHG